MEHVPRSSPDREFPGSIAEYMRSNCCGMNDRNSKTEREGSILRE